MAERKPKPTSPATLRAAVRTVIDEARATVKASQALRERLAHERGQRRQQFRQRG